MFMGSFCSQRIATEGVPNLGLLEEEEDVLLRPDPGSGPARRGHLLRPWPHAWADAANEDAYP